MIYSTIPYKKCHQTLNSLKVMIKNIEPILVVDPIEEELLQQVRVDLLDKTDISAEGLDVAGN